MIAGLVGVATALVVVAGTAVALMLALVVCGFAYQWMGGWIDSRRLRKQGRMVDAGEGRRMYLVERGPARLRGQDRTPTVVFEAGFGATSLNWMHIQEALAVEAHTVAYDRCGLGWSSEASSERTPRNIAAELRAMLQAAEIEPPYVLVGHSFGGLVMQRFALDYPKDVAGVVLLDPMRTHEWPPVDPTQHGRVERAMRLTRVGKKFAHVGMARLAARSHLCRSRRFSGFLLRLAGERGAYLAHRLDTEIGKMPEEVRPSIAAQWSSPRFYRGLHAYLSAVPATVEEMHDAEPLGDVPVVVVTPGKAEPVDVLRKFGPQSREVIAEDSEHWVHLDDPVLVVETILEMVEGARGQPAAVRVRPQVGERVGAD
jgi:pimeloyl-ACP methyl ester carboxylesterase